MGHEATLVIYIKNPSVEHIKYHVSLVSKDDLESLPNHPLSPITFNFTISSNPYHEKAYEQVMDKCVKETNQGGEMRKT